MAQAEEIETSPQARREERESHEAFLADADLRLYELGEDIAVEQAQDLAEDIATLTEGARKRMVRSIRKAAHTADQRAADTAYKNALVAAGNIQKWRTLEEEFRSVRVRSEPDVYERGGRESWFRDVALAVAPAAHPGQRDDALDRLRRYGKQVAAESRSLDANGMRVRRTLRNVTRRAADLRDVANAEYRGMTTASGSGGAFVPPAYVVEDSAYYRSFSPTFTDNAVTKRPLPDYGMTIEVPHVTGPSGVVQQTSENTGVTETDPTAGYVTAAVETFLGIVTASQQLADRAGPIGFDEVIFAQLSDQADTSMDAAVIAAALTGVTPLSRATFSLGGFLSDVGQMATKLTNTAGTVLPPSALVTQPTMAEWLLSQTGTDNRPVFMPAEGMGSRADGFTGYSVSGIPLFTDGSIPLSGGDSQLVMTAKPAVFAYIGEPIVDALPQPGAGSLSVVFRMRRYVAIDVRYASGVAAATGAAYPAAPTWA